MAKVTVTGYGDLAFLAQEASAPFRETLAWYTDVFNSYNGTESRLALRRLPRQSFSMKYAAQHLGGTQDLFNTLYGALDQIFAVPVWSEATYVGTVALGATGLALDTTIRDFRAGTLALIWGCDGWQLVKLTTVDAGAVTFPATAKAVRAAYFMPVRVGRVQPGSQRTVGGLTHPAQVEYEIDDPLGLSPAAPDQFLGEDIYFDEALLNGESSTTEKFLGGLEETDGELGPVVASSPWTYHRVARPMRLVAEDAASAWTLREFLHRRMGRYRRFWQPSFNNDIRLRDRVGPLDGQPYELGSTIKIWNDSNYEWALGRTHIAVQALSTGAWTTHTIEETSIPGTDYINVSLDTAPAILSTDIKRICWLGLKRFDADRIDINWLGAGACEVSVPTLEVTP